MSSHRVNSVRILPKKKVASPTLSYLISFVVLGLIILGVVFIFKKLFIFTLIPIICYLLLWLLSTRFSWFISQELSIFNNKLKIVHIGTVSTLGGGKTTYMIGKILSVEESFGDLVIKVEDATVQEHPMKPKSCKKVRVYECNEDAKKFIKDFMEVDK